MWAMSVMVQHCAPVCTILTGCAATQVSGGTSGSRRLAPDHAARKRARVIAAVDHDLAVDDHGGDSGRVLMRVLVRRAVADPGGIEHSHVRPRPGPQEAAIA